MSTEEFFLDIFHGNISHAMLRFQDWYSHWPQPLKDMVHRLTGEGTDILWATGETILADILGGKGFEAAVDDGWATIKDQAASKSRDDLADIVGLLKRQPAPPPPPA